ncbi:MAG: Ribosomal protein [Pseudomonadota bacterium]|jgi:ribosomal protein S18
MAKKMNKNDLNSMSGDITIGSLQNVPGISTIALSLKQTFNSSTFFVKRSNAMSCSLSNVEENQISYKNITLLKKYVAPVGKMIPARSTGVRSRKKQRILRTQIIRARYLGLLCYVKY